MRKLPIGVQSFASLRGGDYVYIDKTEYIYKLVNQSKQYFLSRPRRFGKSLLLSTMRAYFEGRKELFEGLKIDELTQGEPDAWLPYPVFYFDFNGKNYQQDLALEDMLDYHLRQWEEQYDIQAQDTALEERFRRVLATAHEQTGLGCVVLVDEYDKPLLETLESEEREEHNKAVFKGFFGVLKSYDEHLKFVFITGVTKFSKVSIFSDLNQLRDISLTEEYAGICGITESELNENFAPEISEMAEKQGYSVEECLDQLRRTYDGYHFHPGAEGVYNPFSLLQSFADKDFGAYWFSTGTPTFLVRRIRESGFDVRRFTDDTLYANDAMLSDYRADNPDMIPLLYQTGYLTILGYDKTAREYTLGFPNEEVKYGFLQSLMPEYIEGCGTGSGKDIFTLRRYILGGRIEDVMDVLTALFASIPYTSNDSPFEHYFQTVIYLVFTLLGHYTQCEMHTYRGRVDCIVESPEYVYIFEFKRDESADAALAQIEEMDYAAPYAADKRHIYKIGVSFDTDTRSLKEWKTN